MTPVIPSSVNNVLLISGTPFPTRKRVCLKRCNLLRNSTKQTLLSQKYILPLSKSLRLLPQSRSGFSLHHESRIHKISATGTDIAVEEAGSPVADEDSGGGSESPSDAVGTSEASSIKSDANVTPAQRKHSRPARKSDMPPVKPEDLVPGATFTGKIRSIQPFGAFVDFGAFTDGLVHVSRLSDSFVTDVGNVVSVGQEVKVRLVEANMETGRISLTMRESDDISKLQQRRDGPASSDRGRSPRKSTPRSNQRRDEVKKRSKFVKGQDLDGTVKNLTRSGSFISLPEGEEGFLPASEELDEGFGNIMGGSSLQVGQEVNVRVLRITRGQVTLTMKKEEDIGELDLKLSQGVVHTATNPFMLAFRKNKDIAEFLDEREKEAEAAEGSGIPQTSDEMKGKVSQTETELVEVQDQQASSSEESDTAISVVDETVEDDETSTQEVGVESSIVEDASNDIANDKKDLESIASDSLEGIDGRIASDSSEGIDGVVQSTKEGEEVRSEILAPEESDSSDQLAEDAPAVDEVKNDGESELLGQTADQDEVRSEILAPEESDTSYHVAENAPAVDRVKNDGENDLLGQTADQEEVRSEILAPEERDTSDQLAKDTSAVDGMKTDGESDLPGQTADQEEVSSKILAPEESDASDQLAEDASAIDGVKNDGESDLRGQTADQEEVRSEILAPEESDTSDQLAEDAPTLDGVKNDGESDLLGQTADQISSEIHASKEVSQIANNNQSPENVVADSLQSVDSAAGRTEEKMEVSSEILSPEGGASATDVSTTDRFENVGKSDLSGQISDPIMSESAISKEATENQIDVSIEKDELKTPSPNAGNESLSAIRIDDEKVGINPDKNGSITSSNEQIDVTKVQQSTTEESHVTEELENEIDYTKAKGELKNGTTTDSGTPTALVEDEKVESVPEKNNSITNSNGQSSVASPSKNTIKAISPALVKQLREETGAGMMDCKKALSETGGNLVKAQEFLRKKGLASADKKASRVTAEGRIGSYIHDSRIGVLIEVNCETDFVSRGDIFKELVDDLAMQVAACPQVQYLVTEDVPKDIVDKEREIEMQKEDLLSKPEQIRSKIVEGRIRKRLEELALLEQPYIKNDKLVVKDWVKQTIATIGENMKVKRFVRFNLGEGLERKSQDFAAEVAAQTAAKPVSSPGKEQPAAVEAKEAVDTPVKATVSAALVKQLREETGAGMMDCKKALSETGGELEKAQEYLRKKGLSTADKKSSRLAAEGRIGSYIHDSRIGVLIEVNCETDFVGRSEKFKELVDDLAMQVVACPQVQYVSVEEIQQSIVSKEKELEMQREDLQSKPESIRERIVEGRVSKRLGELALLEQPFIKNDSILVKDLVKQTVAALGENIKVRRFVRFTLGETNESVETENAA